VFLFLLLSEFYSVQIQPFLEIVMLFKWWLFPNILFGILFVSPCYQQPVENRERGSFKERGVEDSFGDE